MQHSTVATLTAVLWVGLVSAAFGESSGAIPTPEDPAPGVRLDPFAPTNNALRNALDTDSNDELSADEIEAAAKSLKGLDKDSDGKLSAEEMDLARPVPRPAPGGIPGGGARFGGPWFAMLGSGGPSPGGFPFGGPRRPAGFSFERRLMTRDASGDGRVAQDEMPESMRSLFPWLDLDHNGSIDAEEASQLSGRLLNLHGSDRILAALASEESLPPNVVEEVRSALELAEETAVRAEQEIAAQRRSEWVLYLMSVSAMLAGVISFGHLLTSHPPAGARWREVDASPSATRGVVCSAAFICVLSAFDLVWTNAHAANLHFRELNPLGSLLLADGISPTAFKITAVATSVVLLVWLRRFRAAQTAAWWLCLVCTLLTFRWVMLDSALLN